MPTYIGKKLCPSLIVRPTRYEEYKKIAEEAREIFSEFDVNFTSYSHDEATLNITSWMEGLKLSSQDGVIKANALAETIRRKVFEKTQLTTSCGKRKKEEKKE